MWSKRMQSSSRQNDPLSGYGVSGGPNAYGMMTLSTVDMSGMSTVDIGGYSSAAPSRKGSAMSMSTEQFFKCPVCPNAYPVRWIDTIHCSDHLSPSHTHSLCHPDTSRRRHSFCKAPRRRHSCTRRLCADLCNGAAELRPAAYGFRFERERSVVGRAAAQFAAVRDQQQ